MSTGRILLLIFAFLAVILGSFVWFVATWDREAEPSLSFILQDNLPPEAPGSRHMTRFPAEPGTAT
jgi:hypothetical protein